MASNNSYLDILIEEYDRLIKTVDKEAKDSRNLRAYGGFLRSKKGTFVEWLAKKIIRIAWSQISNEPSRLNIVGRQIKIPLKKDYLERIKEQRIKNHILENINRYYYLYKPDILVEIDGNCVLVVECKSYTENAMFKRILVDFFLLKQVLPKIDLVLLQLESQLGGDYSELKDITYGSYATHTLMSYFNLEINIITLLKGERKVNQPIHDPRYYKPLTHESLERALNIFIDLLGKYVS